MPKPETAAAVEASLRAFDASSSATLVSVHCFRGGLPGASNSSPNSLTPRVLLFGFAILFCSFDGDTRLRLPVDEGRGGFVAGGRAQTGRDREEERRDHDQPDQLTTDPVAALAHGAEEVEERRREEGESKRLQQAREGDGGGVLVGGTEDLRVTVAADSPADHLGDDQQRHRQEGEEGDRLRPARLPLQNCRLAFQLQPLS